MCISFIPNDSSSVTDHDSAASFDCRTLIIRHMQVDRTEASGRTLTQQAILLLRYTAYQLDQRTRLHVHSLCCAAHRRGTRAGQLRTKLKDDQYSVIPVVVGRRRHSVAACVPLTPRPRRALEFSLTLQNQLPVHRATVSTPPTLCAFAVHLERCGHHQAARCRASDGGSDGLRGRRRRHYRDPSKRRNT